ncbi:transporter [Rasiella sp. SM2506]|uniref:transporter n=1 Tax=Rasiella sp. SM2506 TaxID=3423914 RepID=UPI003D7ACED3
MKKVLSASFLFFCGMLYAQEETTTADSMITDRPDATESPNTVPKGSLQVETGGFYTSFEENDLKTEIYGYNTTLVRYGIFNNFEVRLGWNFEETRFSFNGQEADNVSSGFTPLLAGMKVEIADEDGWKPQIGLLGHLYLPFTAGSDYRPETTGADFRFSFSHTLSEKSSLSYNLGAALGNDSPELAYLYTLSYGYSITNKIGLYAEVYGDFPEDNKANHLWDAGITYLLHPTLQLDATIGSSFTAGQDILLSAGVSFRIPN